MNPALDIKWFLQLNGNVKGPFSQDALQSTLQTLDDSATAQALIWKRGLPDGAGRKRHRPEVDVCLTECRAKDASAARP